jgi:hypothetical protein
MRLMLYLVLAVALMTGSADAAEKKEAVQQFYSGNILFDLCRNRPKDIACWGYIIGVADAMGTNEMGRDVDNAYGNNAYTIPGWRACIVSVRFDQLIDVVMNFFRQHPELRDAVASANIARALAEAFPCPPGNR